MSTSEWEGLPKPSGVDKDTGTWAMNPQEYAALQELCNGEANGRLRFERYLNWIVESSGMPRRGGALRVVVIYPPLNS